MELTATLENLVQATAGSLGAFLSTCVVFPLDKIKARLQADGLGKDRQGCANSTFLLRFCASNSEQLAMRSALT